MRPVILKTGTAKEALRAERGDYDAWFARTIGLPLERFHVIDAVAGGALPEGVDGVIVTGSSKRVHEHEPWSVQAGEWLARVVRSGAPVLGVCYGHQLIGDAFGGDVGPNPNGREIGLIQVEVTEDPLFEGLPRRFPVLQTHKDTVNKPPRDARVLGGSPRTPIEAMAIGDHTRTVQWHPEFDAGAIRYLIEQRAEAIDEESGAGTAKRLLEQVREVDTGRVVLQNFARHFLGMDV